MKIIRLLLWNILCLGGLLYACQKSNLEQALDAAGDNRKELETVLKHYKDDPQKLQAARFLIENMDAHYFFEGKAVTAYYHYMDSVFRNCKGDRDFWIKEYDSILKRTGDAMQQIIWNPTKDISKITADYLISNIDSSFLVWQKNWNKQYSFDIFLKYVLPYRIGNEQISDWRSKYIMPITKRNSYNDNVFNVSYVYEIATNILKGKRVEHYYPSQILPDFPLDMGDSIKLATCRQFAHYCVAAFRANGIPAAIDFIPQWGNRSMGHEWCTFFINNTTCIPNDIGEQIGTHFMLRKEDRIPKVFRSTFEKQKNSLYMQNKGEEMLPLIFDTPCIKDVTKEYIETSNIEVDLYENKQNTKYFYLSIFNDRNWSIVDWSKKQNKKATFVNVGRDIVYMPVYYINDSIIPAGFPFLLNKDGNKIPIMPNFNKKENVTLKRKYRDDKAKEFLQFAVGGKFQVANKKDFSDSLTIYTIPKLKDNKFYTIFPKYKGNYKYFRYVAPDNSRGNLAELHIFNEKGHTILPKFFLGNSNVRKHHDISTLFDNDALTFFDSNDLNNVWYGWEIEDNNIHCISFLPRNDDNFIRENESYELLFWNKNKWESLGIQKGDTSAILHYDNVPRNALLLLHNLTKGVEERIFLYKRGKQIWK